MIKANFNLLIPVEFSSIVFVYTHPRNEICQTNFHDFFCVLNAKLYPHCARHCGVRSCGKIVQEECQKQDHVVIAKTVQCACALSNGIAN